MNKSDLKQIKAIVDGSLKGFATKTDLERFATKTDLERFATKTDLERFVTFAELKKELKNLATKDDLQALKKELKDHADDAFAVLAASTIKRKADREEVEKLEVRVEKLEQHAY